MFITLEKNTFREAVGIVSRFAENKSTTLPSLMGVAVIAGDAGIKLRATNLETAIDLQLEGTIKEMGAVVLPAHNLRDISATLGSTGSITIEQTGDTITLHSEAGKSVLKTLPYEDFPSIPLPENPTISITIKTEDLQSLISSVVQSASPSVVRPELASVLFSSEGGVLTTVATDSFRLSEKKLTLSKSLPPFSLLIPAKNIHTILQSLPNTSLELQANEHQCAFMWSGGVITTRLTSGTYPDYTQIIPKSTSTEAIVLKKDLEAGLRRVAVFSDTFQKIRLHINPSSKGVTISAKNNDIGESEEKIPGSITGEEIELSFNHKYITTPLSFIDTDTVTISASGIGRAVIIRGTGDNSYLYLVMPMNN